jgi:hypothetical protein
MRDLDLVTDRNCLRKLLRFVSEDVDQSFRIDVKIQGGVSLRVVPIVLNMTVVVLLKLFVHRESTSSLHDILDLVDEH